MKTAEPHGMRVVTGKPTHSTHNLPDEEKKVGSYNRQEKRRGVKCIQS